MKKNISKEKFKLFIDMSRINNSMELDSGVEVAASKLSIVEK